MSGLVLLAVVQAHSFLRQDKKKLKQREMEDRGGRHAVDVLGWIQIPESQGICARCSQIHQSHMPAL